MPKPNPIIAALEKKYKAEKQDALDMCLEFGRISFLLTVNEQMKVGPGRAGYCLAEFMAKNMEIANAVVQDYGPDKRTGDKQMLHTKAQLCRRIKTILSPEDWEKYKHFFPFLQEFWDE